MDEEEIDSLIGQVRSLSMVLNAITSTLPQLQAAQAAQAALQLAIDLQVSQEEDETVQTPIATARARDSIVTAYLDLLKARASHG